MKTRMWLAAGALLTIATAWGCGGDDSTTDGGGTTGGTGGVATGGTGGDETGGTGGGGTGGTGGAATGGTGGGDTGGTGGAATGGTGGGDTGGTGGAATGGTGGSNTGGTGGGNTGGTGGGTSFWADSYNPNGSPSPSSGNHHAGDNCLNCHTGNAPAWLFGGTIFLAGGGGAAHVQVGVKDANGLYTAYSATNGNFWYPKGSASVNWANAEIRARNANGEIVMSNTASGACNSCHTGSMQLVAP